MRTSIAIAVFLVIGGGAAASGAALSMAGSDTMFEITNDVLLACPNVSTLTYAGGGSGNGQKAMGTAQAAGNTESSQLVSPMSSGVKTCAGQNNTNSSFDPSGESGLVIGLDGLSMLGNTGAGASTTCSPSGSCTPDLTKGLATSTSINYTDRDGTAKTYTFSGWKDVLALLYAGFTNDSGYTMANRDCNHPARRALAENYGALFQTPASCAGSCTAVKHAFRRDDASGTTDVFRSLVGIPQPSTSTHVTPFCNAIVPGSSTGATNTWWNTLGDKQQSYGPLGTRTVNGVAYPAVNIFQPDYQDFDPVRRACDGTNNSATDTTTPTEQVCDRAGELGLVLVVIPTDKLSGTQQTEADKSNAFQVGTCATGKTSAWTAPQPLNAPTGQSYLWCPNGALSKGTCSTPKTSDNKPCFTGKGSAPSVPGTLNISVDPLYGSTKAANRPSQSDGRVYNLFLRRPTVPNQFFTDQFSPTARKIVGAFYRLHTTRSLDATRIVSSCQEYDATSQIGCLVTASPCSIGYAGRSSSIASTDRTAPISVNGIPNDDACIDSFTYPLSRKLYLNSLMGFGWLSDHASQGTDTAAQLQLAKCMAGTQALNAVTLPHGEPASVDTMSEILQFHGFRPVPATMPRCEDFDEATHCGAASNVNACTTGGGNTALGL